MNLLAIAGILTAVSSTGFGIFVYAQNVRRALYRKWFIFTISVAIWGAGVLCISLATDPFFAYGAWRLSFGLGVVWIPVLFLDFTLTFCEIVSRRLLAVAYLSGLLFSLAAIFTPYFFADVRLAFGSLYYGVPDWRIFSLFMLWWFGLVIYAHYLLVRTYPTSIEPKKLQIRYFFIATAVGFCTGALAYLPFFHIELYPWGTFGIPLYPVIMSWAALEYHLLDVNLAARRALFSSVTIALIAFGLLIIGFASRWIASHLGISPLFLALIGSMIAFVLGNIVWRRVKMFEQLRYEFVVVAAHRLRTPLTEIRWATSGLDQIQSVVQARDAAAHIMSASNRLLDLINSLLQSIRLDDKTLTYTFETCNLRTLAENALAEHQLPIERKHLQVSLECDLTEPLVRADKERLMYVIQIFFDNAVLYTPSGGSIDVHIASHNNDFIIFRIRDTGIGIDKEERGHLFTRLYRGTNALRAYTEGSGLGLFAAKEIMERHKGMVGAESEGPGKGSVFWFIVPKAL